MKGGLIAGLGAIVLIVIGFWLFIIVVKVAVKLIGFAIILGLAAALYFWVKSKFGGSKTAIARRIKHTPRLMSPFAARWSIKSNSYVREHVTAEVLLLRENSAQKVTRRSL